MDKGSKKALMKAVTYGTYRFVKEAFRKHNLVFDESYLDYKLLQVALDRRHEKISNFLIGTIGCRVNKPNKIKPEKTPLHLATKLDNEIIIAKLLNKGASLTDTDENGETPLVVGFKNKNYKAANKLLDYYKPNCQPDDEDAMFQFHIACILNHTRVASRYLHCGLNPNRPISLDSEEYSGSNPMHLAAEKCNYRLLRILVLMGGDLSIKNAKGLTPLQIIYYANAKEKAYAITSTFEIKNDSTFVNSVDTNGVSHFHLCCMTNEPDSVKVFLDNGADVNSSTSSNCPIDPGFTPLHFAVINGCEKVVELLLKSGADCNKKNSEGRTPLHLACTTTHSTYSKKCIIKVLLDYKANPTAADNHGYTPFHMIFYYLNNDNKSHNFAMLPKMSGQINCTNEEGLSHFHIACTYDTKQVKDFLDYGVSVDSCVSSGIFSGYTALHFAALYNQKDVVELLLEKKARVNMKTEEFQVTPLHLACELNYAKFYEDKPKEDLQLIKVELSSNRKNQYEIINLLLLNGAHVDAKDYEGITPLFHIFMTHRNYFKLTRRDSIIIYFDFFRSDFNKEISTGVTETAKLLLFYEANVYTRSNSQETILHVICKCGFLENIEELIELILSKGVDIDAVDDAGLTPLHLAVKANNSSTVKILLKHKANVHIKCKNSEIPLRCLFSNYRKTFLKSNSDEQKILLVLLKNGSDLNIKLGIYNNLLLHEEIGMHNDFVVEQLLKYGADINQTDLQGHTCLDKFYRAVYSGTEILYEADTLTINTFTIVFIHVQKILALGLCVSERLRKQCRNLYEHYNTVLFDEDSDDEDYQKMLQLNGFFNICVEEVEEMKSVMIDNSTSLYGILLKDPCELSGYARNENLLKIVNTECLNNFPLYSNLIEAQFTRCSTRTDLLQFAYSSLRSVFNIYLPDLCCEAILRNLDNKDLANLKTAAAMKISSKRKRDDTSLTDIESSLSSEKKIKIGISKVTI